jgi:hypothetical protein
LFSSKRSCGTVTGTHFGNVRGYKLGSILKLGDSKSKTVKLNGKPATMAHGVVQAATHGRDGDTPKELAEKLSVCSEAWIYPLSQLLADVSALEKDTRFLERRADQVDIARADRAANEGSAVNTSRVRKEGDQLEEIVLDMRTEFRQAMNEFNIALRVVRSSMANVSREKHPDNIQFFQRGCLQSWIHTMRMTLIQVILQRTN